MTAPLACGGGHPLRLADWAGYERPAGPGEWQRAGTEEMPLHLRNCPRCRSTASLPLSRAATAHQRTTRAQREAAARWFAVRRCERANAKLAAIWARTDSVRPCAAVGG